MTTQTSWRSLTRLPTNGEGGIRVLGSGGSQPLDRDLVTTYFARWTPFSRALLGSPAWHRYYPPVRHLKLRQRIRQRAARIHLWAASAWLALGIFDGLVSLAKGRFFSPLSLALLVLGVVLLHERHVLLSHKHALFERALFFGYLHDRREVRLALAVVLVIAVLAFASQEMLVARLGDARFLAAVGLYREVPWIESYRLLTGPMIHADFGHLVTNLAMALVVVPVAASLGSPYSLSVFLIANAAGGWLQLQLGSAAYQYYFGASAGVLSLYTLAFSLALRRPRALPPRLGFTLLGAALISILGAEGLIKSAATVGHIAGAAIGVLAGACADRFSWPR